MTRARRGPRARARARTKGTSRGKDQGQGWGPRAMWQGEDQGQGRCGKARTKGKGDVGLWHGEDQGQGQGEGRGPSRNLVFQDLIMSTHKDRLNPRSAVQYFEIRKKAGKGGSEDLNTCGQKYLG